MLPEGFHWQPHMDAQTLVLGGRMLANYSKRPNAPYALAYLHCGTARYTGRTYASEAIARAYIEAYARNLQAELRAEYGVDRHGAPSQADAETSSPRESPTDSPCDASGL